MKSLCIATIGIFLLISISCSKSVELNNQDWSCAQGICKIKFSLKNNENHETIRKIRIIAYSQTDIAKGAIVYNIIGERVFYVELKPKEQKNITEKLNLYSYLSPSMVVISHFDAGR